MHLLRSCCTLGIFFKQNLHICFHYRCPASRFWDFHRGCHRYKEIFPHICYLSLYFSFSSYSFFSLLLNLLSLLLRVAVIITSSRSPSFAYPCALLLNSSSFCPSRFLTRLVFAGFELAGLAKGGQKIRQCAEAWAKCVKLLVELASLQVWSTKLRMMRMTYVTYAHGK